MTDTYKKRYLTLGFASLFEILAVLDMFGLIGSSDFMTPNWVIFLGVAILIPIMMIFYFIFTRRTGLSRLPFLFLLLEVAVIGVIILSTDWKYDCNPIYRVRHKYENAPISRIREIVKKYYVENGAYPEDILSILPDDLKIHARMLKYNDGDISFTPDSLSSSISEMEFQAYMVMKRLNIIAESYYDQTGEYPQGLDDILNDSLRNELDRLPLMYSFDMSIVNGKPEWRATPNVFYNNETLSVFLDSTATAIWDSVETTEAPVMHNAKYITPKYLHREKPAILIWSPS